MECLRLNLDRRMRLLACVVSSHHFLENFPHVFQITLPQDCCHDAHNGSLGCRVLSVWTEAWEERAMHTLVLTRVLWKRSWFLNSGAWPFIMPDLKWLISFPAVPGTWNLEKVCLMVMWSWAVPGGQISSLQLRVGGWNGLAHLVCNFGFLEIVVGYHAVIRNTERALYTLRSFSSGNILQNWAVSQSR